MREYFTATKEALRNLTSKPNTVLFPGTHVEVPDDIRGTPVLEAENCTLCMKCERVCPTKAIVIHKNGKKEADFSIDLGLCCYCGECEDACNFDAIELDNTWLTAQLDRSLLVTTKHVVKS